MGGARSPFRVGGCTRGGLAVAASAGAGEGPWRAGAYATATVLLSLVDNGQIQKAFLGMLTGFTGPEVALLDVNVYLIITIRAVSSLLVLTLVLYMTLQSSAPPTEGRVGQEARVGVLQRGVGLVSQQWRQRVALGGATQDGSHSL